MQYEYAKRMGGLSGSAIREILKMTADPSVISFAGGMPSASSFPTEELAQIDQHIADGELNLWQASSDK